MKVLTSLFSVCCILLLHSPFSVAQESGLTPGDGWRLASEINLTQTQNAYSDNWSGDEYGSISWAFTMNSVAERQLSTLLNNRSTMRLSFGQTHNQEKTERHWQEPFKSTDLIDMESVLRMTVGGFADPYTAFHWQCQFYDSDNMGGEDWIDPNTFTESMGLARNLINEEKRQWIFRLGFGIRQHLDRSALFDSTKSEWSSRETNDGGVELVSELTTPLVEDKLKMTSKLTVFTALFYSEADRMKGLENEDYWRSPDINLETIFTANITRYIMVNLYTQLLYDKEVDLAGRFKETMSLGLTYAIF